MKRKLLFMFFALFAFYAMNAQIADIAGKGKLNDVDVFSKGMDKMHSVKGTLFSDDFSTLTGWVLEGTWGIGEATVEPIGDHTQNGDNIIMGGPLNADYINSNPQYFSTSPVIDCSAQAAVTFGFWSFSGCENNSWDHMGIEVWDGAAWVSIYANGTTSFQENVWTYWEFDVSAYAAGNANFQIRFYFGPTDTSVTYSGWGIDDVMVTYPEGHDLGVTAISPTVLQAGNTVAPQVTVFNFGGNDETTWSVQLTDGAGYDETVVDPGTITIGSDYVVDFPDWTPAAGTYTLTATVTVTDDGNAGNDVLTQEVFVYALGDAIYEQHDLVTHPGAGSGGADVSALQGSLGLTTYGGGFQVTATNSMADDFTVAAGETWTINGFTFYSYQTGSTTTSTITDALIRVYDGNPSSGGSVIQDFWAGGNLATSFWTGIYRTQETDMATATTRPIMFVHCAVPEFSLTEGQYWVEVSCNGTLASGPWTPPVTLLGIASTGDAFQNVAGTWNPWVDGTYAQGMCFDVLGTITVEGAAPITFVVDNTANTSFTGFALKGSWDAMGNYDATWNGGVEQADFYDDGTHGDVTGGDDIWTVTVNLMTDAGANTWEWGVNDQDGNWIDGNFQFTVPDETPQTLTYATVGVKELLSGINIYPNPSTGVFSINVDQITKLEVYDITGKLMNTQTINGLSSIQLNNAGVYFLRFSNDEGSAVQRVVVK